MAKFRSTQAKKTVVNHAGGEAFSQDPKLELVSLLLTSFVNDKFYEKAADQLDRLEKLTAQIKDKTFVAKAAIFARKEYGMRSITHALIGELVHEVKGTEWVKRAVEKTVNRPDDILEMVAYYANKYGKPIPNSLKKGAALALNQFDSYQLGKYRGERSDVKMVDIFNLFHPKPSKRNGEAFKALVDGELKTTGTTWEAKLSEAGKAESDESVADLKKEAWGSLLKEGKLGYMALLKNLRNIEQQAPESLDLALNRLVDPAAIKKSMVLPFRFNTAAKEVTQRKTLDALNDAFEIALANVPKFDGKTLIALDCSGSMQGAPMEIGSLFSAVLHKANPDADFMRFGDHAEYVNLSSRDSALSIAKSMRADLGGTDFKTIFYAADKKYDRVIVLSDMQGWMGYNAPTGALAAYEQKLGAKPFIYSFDLAGHGTLQFPQERVFAIAGFSEKCFDLFKALEEDRNALIHKIEAIAL